MNIEEGNYYQNASMVRRRHNGKMIEESGSRVNFHLIMKHIMQIKRATLIISSMRQDE